MTASSSAIEQAVELLRSRLSEARADIQRLSQEADAIIGALNRLGFTADHGVTETPQRQAELRPVAPARQPTPVPIGSSVSAAVVSLIQSEEGPWTPSHVRDRLRGTDLQAGRADDKFLDVIRTAMHNMRKRGLATHLDDGSTIATKWLGDAEAPGATGASDTEELNGSSSRQEGESREYYANLPRDGDHHPDYTGRDLHHG